MAIPEKYLNEIQDRLDIVEFISGCFPLKRAGRNYKALCPFHHEKSPSFMVNPEKQIFHCFGCGEGGNLFQFAMKYERLSFLEAVRSLAERARVVLPEMTAARPVSSESARLVEANQLAVEYYHSLLTEKPLAETARRYLSDRGISEQTLKRFQLGYASPAFDGLLRTTQAKGFQIPTLLKAGLVLQGEKGLPRDRFRNRIIFPILNARGQPIAFGGRVLDAAEPKYLNSPETELYVKGKELYGLSLAAQAIRKEDQVFLVEGYFDAIALHQAGMEQTVATLGTSLTQDHARLLKRYTRNVVVIFDPDPAGESASLRGIDLLLEEDLSIRLLTLPGKEDPDAFVRRHGKEALMKAVGNAKDLVSYQIDRLSRRFNVKEAVGKSRLCEVILPTIVRVRSAIARSEYLKELAERLSIREEDLHLELKRFGQGQRTAGSSVRPSGASQMFPPAEVLLLLLLLEETRWVSPVRQKLSPGELTDGRTQKILERLFEQDETKQEIKVSHLAQELTEQLGSRFFAEFLDGSLESLNREKALWDCVEKIQSTHRRRRLESIQSEIKAAERLQNEAEVRRLMSEFLTLRKGTTLYGKDQREPEALGRR